MYIVLDTNILLLDASNLTTIAQSYNNATVVLPETVLDEIDSKKSGHSEIAYQARQFGRLLTTAQTTNTIKQNGLTVTELLLDNLPIHVVSADKYPYYSEHTANIVNDRKIIHIAKLYTNRHSDVLFISNDVMCRLRAQAEGIQVSAHKLVENTNLKFTHKFSLPLDEFTDLDGKDVTTLSDDVPPECTNFVIECQDTGQIKLATTYNNILTTINRDTEAAIRRQDCPPINTGQIFLSRAILDPTVDIVLCEARSGSGKTMVAISSAMQTITGNSRFKNIVYMRNTVDDVGERDEEIGFLSGNEDKIKGYLSPFYDTLEVIARNKLKNSKLKGAELETKVATYIDELIGKYNMRPIPALHTRGRTFNDSIVIIDEAQNFSQATMNKVLTRLGKNTKVIIIGSLRQIDSKYLTKYTSGLSVLLNSCKTPNQPISISAIALEKVVRGPITEWAEKLFAP